MKSVLYDKTSYKTVLGPSGITISYLVDLPANELVANMKSFLGEYSCPTCDDIHCVWAIDISVSFKTDESV